MRHFNKILSLMFLLLLTGCFAHVEHLPKADPKVTYFPSLQDKDDVLIGVALSGGGSRAALFGAAGLEALARLRVGSDQHSLLDQISYLSSVSGGSVASSYFAMKKPVDRKPVLNNDGSLTQKYQDFFEQYKEAMSQNFQRSFELRQFFNIRWLNPTKRATSLSEVLDDRFLDKMTLNDLYKREAQGDSPHLLLNSTLYNNGRRFVITTLPPDAFDYDFLAKLRDELKGNDAQRIQFPASLAKAMEELRPMTFFSKEVEADPRGVSLSKAVAASASFPPIVGPVSVQVEGNDRYWHAGDGGLFDNQGTESLAQVLLKKVDEDKSKRALIIALDSSYPFSVGNAQLDSTEKGFSVFLEDPSRIVGIMEERANAYQHLVWHILQSRGLVLPDQRRIKIIVLRHTNAEWNKDLSDLPQACKDEESGLDSKEAVTQRLAQIPTLFKIESECDKQLLITAASKVVSQRKEEIVKFLEGR
jgi:predicted acylesterase/phospholipase RssA